MRRTNGTVAERPIRGWPEHFEILDASRGLAALAVVFHHLGYGLRFNLGHLSVMVFFVISGYCISASVESCIRKGLGFRQYMWRRIRRIYPPYFFAVLFFLGTRVIKAQVGMAHQFPKSLVTWIQTFTLTQWLTLVMHPARSAADNGSLIVAAFWSLNYEEQFYLVIGLMMLGAAALKRSVLAFVWPVMVCGIAWNWVFPAKSFGFFLEYWPHFGVGCLVFYRLCRVRSTAARRAIDGSIAALAVVALGMLCFSGAEWSARGRIVYVEWLAVSAFALVLIALRPVNAVFAKSVLGAVLLRLGKITYSLYLVHQFNLHFAKAVSTALLPQQWPQGIHALVQASALVAIATVFWYFCERPFLNKRLAVASPHSIEPSLKPALLWNGSPNRSSCLEANSSTSGGDAAAVAGGLRPGAGD